MNWSSWKSRLSSIDVSSAIGSIKENTSSAMSFVKNISSSEPQQYIEAEQLGIYYITNNVIAMGYPSQESLFSGTSIENISTRHATFNKITKFVSDSLANKIAKYLTKYHKERYMIWNLSEKSYNTQIFNDQVIEFKFPGYPSPPLQQLFELLSSIDNWLLSKDENIAIIHCQTGKGRTVTVISAYLAWSKYNNFTPAKALLHCCKIMNGTIKNMTIPSQTRYLAYLTKVLINKQIPKQRPLIIQRVIVHKIPIFEINQQTYVIKNKSKTKTVQKKSPSLLLDEAQSQSQSQSQFVIGSIDEDHDDLELGQNIIVDEKEAKEKKQEEQKAEEQEKKEQEINEIDEINETKTIKRSGVRPYIQIFKNAKLIFSSRRKNSRLKFYDISEGHIKFEVNTSISGDILIRIRHLCSNGKDKISVCRFAFNCGYLDCLGVIRFKKTQLDGAWNSNKFNKDFWIDLLIGNQGAQKNNNNSERANEFWINIIKRYESQTLSILPSINLEDRYSIDPMDNNTNINNNEWKRLLNEWNLSQYINNFEKCNKIDVTEWKTLRKIDLIEIGLSEVDAQIFLNLNDNAENVANDNNNDIDLIKNKIEINNENEQNILDAMDDSSKEVMKSMSDLMTMSNDKQEEDDKKMDETNETNEIEDDLLTKNAEEDENQQSTVDTFGDLEQYADGLDLEHVEVDSDTEQNFEMLLEELNDDTVHDDIKPNNVQQDDLP